MKGQGLRVASKCLWDPNFDNWASYTFTNESIHCTAIVFGVYMEWKWSSKHQAKINEWFRNKFSLVVVWIWFFSFPTIIRRSSCFDSRDSCFCPWLGGRSRLLHARSQQSFRSCYYKFDGSFCLFRWKLWSWEYSRWELSWKLLLFDKLFATFSLELVLSRNKMGFHWANTKLWQQWMQLRLYKLMNTY